jgi:hypothetical protein
VDQLAAGALIMISTIGITFSMQASFAESPAVDIPLRVVLAAFALVVLFHPNESAAGLACLPVLAYIGYWVVWRRPIANGTTARNLAAHPASGDST